MNNKYLNDAIIGGKEITASYTKNGELLRLMYSTPDFRQFLDFFHTGVKINDSCIIYLHEDQIIAITNIIAKTQMYLIQKLKTLILIWK